MVSVIIPCYNQGAYIQETIDSVLAQTYTSWEIIIVNDGSTDIETIIKLEELERDNYKVIHIENSGVSVARNVGIANANGEFILPLDADDKIAPTYIAEAIQILENNSALKLVYADCGFFGELQGISPVPSFTLKGILFENLIYNAAIFRKTDFNKTNGYDSAFRTGWEDWDFWLDFIKNEKEVYKINKVLFYYRIKKESRNSLIVNEKRALCEQQLYKKHIDKYNSYFDKPITLLNEFDTYKNEYSKLENYRLAFYKSKSYRLGDFLLRPIKFLFKK